MTRLITYLIIIIILIIGLRVFAGIDVTPILMLLLQVISIAFKNALIFSVAVGRSKPGQVFINTKGFMASSTTSDILLTILGLLVLLASAAGVVYTILRMAGFLSGTARAAGQQVGWRRDYAFVTGATFLALSYLWWRYKTVGIEGLFTQDAPLASLAIGVLFLIRIFQSTLNEGTQIATALLLAASWLIKVAAIVAGFITTFGLLVRVAAGPSLVSTMAVSAASAEGTASKVLLATPLSIAALADVKTAAVLAVLFSLTLVGLSRNWFA